MKRFVEGASTYSYWGSPISCDVCKNHLRTAVAWSVIYALTVESVLLLVICVRNHSRGKVTCRSISALTAGNVLSLISLNN
jgi:hypothetical protein